MQEIDEQVVQTILKHYVPKRYLNQKEACKYAGTSPATMNKWKALGLKLIFIDGESSPRYDTKDIDEFMAKHKI